MGFYLRVVDISVLLNLNRAQGIGFLFSLVPASHAFCPPAAMEQQVISADR
jgi:hypothetical protein